MLLGSVRFGAGEFHHLGPLLGFIGNELSELSRRHWHRLAPKRGKPRLELGIGEDRVDCGARTALTAVLSVSTTSGGVPLGATIPYQTTASYPGTVSPMVGTSGSASARLPAVTPSARNLPALMWAIEPGRLSNITWTRLVSRSCIAGAEP